MRIYHRLHKYVPSMLLFLLFEAVAITLWLTKDNFFYLLNFSYIGACLGLGTALFYRRETICPAFSSSWRWAAICLLLPWRDFPVKICKSKGSGTTLFSRRFSKQQLSTTRLQKFFGPLLFWAWLVRLRLLDSYGAGLSALQSAAEATKRKAGLPSLCDVFFCLWRWCLGCF